MTRSKPRRRPRPPAHGIGILAALLCLAPASPALADPADASGGNGPKSVGEQIESVGGIALDVALVRALSIGQLAVGTAAFAALSPLSAITWRLDESFEYWVITPFDYAFRRDLGRL
jgi:hypothetical protein